MGQLLELLNSGDDEIRIETIYLLENLTLYPNTLLLFERTNLLIRVLLLLEEGLSLNSNFGVSQTMAALGVIRNYAKVRGIVYLLYLSPSNMPGNILFILQSSNLLLRHWNCHLNQFYVWLFLYYKI